MLRKIFLFSVKPLRVLRPLPHKDPFTLGKMWGIAPFNPEGAFFTLVTFPGPGGHQ